MFGFTPRPAVPDTFWLLYHADLVMEWHVLFLLAIYILLWRHRRPRETRLLWLAIVFHALSDWPPHLVSGLLGVYGLPIGVLKNFLFAVRPYWDGLSSVVATLLQAMVWWCLVQAAFGDKPPPAALRDET